MYSAPWFLFNPHLETIFPSLLRKVALEKYQRERIATSDQDFLDLDWLKQGSDKLVIISHGLEGNSHRAYVKGMAKAFHSQGFDILAWNYRGCSEEMNKAVRFYHSGATDDLHRVVEHALQGNYEKVFLIGFSLGGNLTMKYLGEREINDRVKGAVALSVPLNLDTSCTKLSQPSNWIYSQRFIKSLKKKVSAKASVMGGIDTSRLKAIRNLREFDDFYTGPLHGFKDATDYYFKCSAIRFLDSIKRPSLILNAKNDPFLSDECFPESVKSSFVKCEYPDRGGHVGFTSFNGNGVYWSEHRALDFILSLM